MPRAPSEWSVDGSGARFVVRAWRPDGAPRAAVCVIHGLGEHSGRYQHVADAFVARGFAVVAPDLRGHGRSSGPRGHAASVKQLLADLSFVLADAERRIGATPWVLYGHSMGGAVALAHALRRPTTIAACIVTGPAVRPGFAPPAWKVALGRAVRRIAPSMSLQNEVNPEGLSHDAEVVLAYRSDPLVHDRISAALGVSLLELGDQLLADAHTLSVPVLIVHGSADAITSPSASRAFATAAGAMCTYVEVPGAFHEVHYEASWGDTWRAMDGWLNAKLLVTHPH